MISIPTLAPAYTSGRYNPNTLFPGPGSGTTYNGLWYDPSDLTTEKVAWRRNLLTYTDDLSNAVWSTNSVDYTVTSDATLAPNSDTIMADLVTFGTNVGAILRSEEVTTAVNTVYTTSIYLKRGNNDWARVVYYTSSLSIIQTVWVNLATGAKGTQSASGTGVHLVDATVTDAGAGWYRITIAGYNEGAIASIGVSMVGADNVTTRVSNATCYVYGAQIEKGSVASSYQALTDFYTQFRAAFPNHTLYQDATSWPLIPVTKLGDPVGLALNRPSSGPLVDGEMVSNPSFSGGTTGWTAGSGATNSTFTAAAGIATLTVVSPDTAPRYVSAITGLRVNQLYKLQLDRAVGDTGTGTRTLIWTTSSAGTGGTTFINPAVGTTERLVVATASTMYVGLAITSATAGATFNVDTVSVRELQGDNAYTQTTGYRPLLDARENLFTYSTNPSYSVVWKNTGVTATALQALAPDGNYNAITVAETTGTASHSIYYNTLSVTSGTYYTFSVYLKKGTGVGAPDWIQLQFALGGFGSGDAYRVNFNLTNGAVGAQGASITAFTATPELNGYFRFSITAQATATSTAAGGYVTFTNNADAGAAPSYTGVATHNLFLWGPQFNIGQTVKPYQSVSGTTGFGDIGAPRGFLFDGTDANLATPNLTWGTTQLSAFIGERRYSVGEGNFGTYFDRNSNRAFTAANTPNNTLRTFIDYSTTDLNVLSTVNSVALSAYNVLSVVWSSGASSSSVAMRCNGVTLSNDVTSTSGTGTQVSDAGTSIKIGNRSTLDRTFNGVIYQIMIRDVATEEAQVQAIENYIAQKLGVTL